MTASEFAFMALGLVLGGASGAALVFVLRSRPPAPREIRLTVGPDAVPRRIPATLSIDAFATAAAEPARGGPADRRSVDRIAVPIESVGIKIHPEADPVFAEIRAGLPSSKATVSAPATLTVVLDRKSAMDRTAAVHGSSVTGDAARATADDRPSGEGGANPAGTGGGGGVPTGSTDVPPGGEGSTVPTQGSNVPTQTSNVPTQTSTVPTEGSRSVPIASGPCADLASRADERCRQADVARLGAERAAEAVADVRREYDDHRAQADRAREMAEPRHAQELKEAARAAFRAARRAAMDRAGMDAAARTWLTTINDLNGSTRQASLALGRHSAAAIALVPTLERLGVEADAARVASDAAAAGCREAEAALAACRDAQVRGVLSAPAMSRPPVAPPDLEAPVREGGTPVVVRIVRGDREARSRVAAALTHELPELDRQWADLLSEFADGVRMRAIEESIVDVAAEHPFWSLFSAAESREIVRALWALGYRYDGQEGWADGHVPGQRDLGKALGYAGQDPMRIRNWPDESEMAELLKDARVAADEFVVDAGGDFDLGEVVDMLGARADSLTDLWDAWETVRPLLVVDWEDAP